MLMGKRQRLEDLGLILAKIDQILDYNDSSVFGASLWDQINSKHDLEKFIERYSDGDKLEELFRQLRWLKDQLEDVRSIAVGELE